MRQVTKNGRALRKGRVTRASNAIRKRQRGQERPLPWDLQCHPQALHRTPTHPHCGTYKPDSGWFVHYFTKAREGHTTAFAEGMWLAGVGDYRVVVDNFGEYRHNDMWQAMGWAAAARSFGFNAAVFVD